MPQPRTVDVLLRTETTGDERVHIIVAAQILSSYHPEYSEEHRQEVATALWNYLNRTADTPRELLQR